MWELSKSTETFEQMSLPTFKKVCKTYVLKFGTKGHSVDAEVLANSVLSLAKAIKLASVHCKYKIDVQISAINPGCVEVPIDIAALDVIGNEDAVTPVMTVISGAADVYRFLNGAPIKAIKEIEGGAGFDITNASDDTKTFAKEIVHTLVVCDDTPVGEAEAYLGKGVDYIALLDDQKAEIFSIKEDEFPHMKHSVISFKNEDESVEVTEADLKVVTIPIEHPENKWEFEYGGQRIKANIEDNIFLERIRNKQQLFGCGDILKARVKIYKTRDIVNGVESVYRYDVGEVLSVVKAADGEKMRHQDDLFFQNNDD